MKVGDYIIKINNNKFKGKEEIEELIKNDGQQINFEYIDKKFWI